MLMTKLLQVVGVAAMLMTSMAEQICSTKPPNLVDAAGANPDMAFALKEVMNHAIATWYTDRNSKEAAAASLQSLVSSCPTDSRLLLVVYGLPQKDCTGGHSTAGFNQNAADYKTFIQKLADAVGTRKALYVVEPDAVGALGSGGCGVAKNYADNLKVALQILSTNPNADIYLDVGYWKLSDAAQASEIAKIVKDLVQGGKVKGISLNTSNYRSNKEISTLCGNFQKAYGDQSLHCITDTSRNFQEPTSTDWCNTPFGAIGTPPSAQTEFPNLDYYVWIKVAGESDGVCNGGPDAGKFFTSGFKQLWNNGYFVKKMGMPAIDGKPHAIQDDTSKATVKPATEADDLAPTNTTSSPSTTTTTTTATPTQKPTQHKKCKAKVHRRALQEMAEPSTPAVIVVRSESKVIVPQQKAMSFAALSRDDSDRVAVKTGDVSSSGGLSATVIAVLLVGAVAAVIVAVVVIRRIRDSEEEGDEVVIRDSADECRADQNGISVI